jgi:hypothetical protein
VRVVAQFKLKDDGAAVSRIPAEPMRHAPQALARPSNRPSTSGAASLPAPTVARAVPAPAPKPPAPRAVARQAVAVPLRPTPAAADNDWETF